MVYLVTPESYYKNFCTASCILAKIRKWRVAIFRLVRRQILALTCDVTGAMILTCQTKVVIEIKGAV